jgi:predicted Na+-dependent transporter
MAVRSKPLPSDSSPPSGPNVSSSPSLSLHKIIGGTLLLAFLTIIGTYVFGGFTGLSAHGVIALVLGVTLSYALGVGLMVAVFHSSRFHDDSAHDAALDHFKKPDEDA